MIENKLVEIDTLTMAANAHMAIPINYEIYNVTEKQVEKFVASLQKHLQYVREAGEQLGVKETLMHNHDRSKFSMEEFPYYVRQFQGDKDDPDGWDQAWLHHIHNNPHHPEHWEIPGVRGKCLRMPEYFAKEMIADWMGASKAYTGSFDMAEWLGKNYYRMEFHSDTRAFVSGILRDELGMI